MTVSEKSRREEQLELEIIELKGKLTKMQEDMSFMAAALENLPNPIFIKDNEAKFIFFNRKYAEAFGMSRADYLGKSALDLDYLPAEDRERYHAEDEELIRTSDIVSYEVDFDFSDGGKHPSFYWSKGIFDPTTGQRGLIGEIVDISKERRLRESLDEVVEELRETNEKLEHLMEIDAGTGVYNRIFLSRENMATDSQGVAVDKMCGLMADLDHFKRVNDTYGHLKGDEILAKFAEILKSECRADDSPIRYGGEEFLIVLSNASLEAGRAVAERIRKRCEKEVLLPDGEPVTVSIGVSEIDDPTNVEASISKLDENMYKAKQMGRNCVVAE